MSTKHTPKAWRYDRETNMVQEETTRHDATGTRTDFRYPRVIAKLPDDWSAVKHGALFAAAPDLLEALEAIVLALSDPACRRRGEPCVQASQFDKFEAARAAISKARGEA